jgi:DNA-binding response OmpR family regulator
MYNTQTMTGQKQRILLVEDDQNFGDVLRSYLEMHEYDVLLETDGEAGLNAYKNGEFNLCIFDVMMPKKDGFTLAEEMKRIDPLFPVIFLTAKSLKVDKLKGFKLGCDDYIVKPVDEEELIARIQAVLKRSKSKLSDQEAFVIGKFILYPRNQQLCLGETIQKLSQKEAKILEMLCNAPGELIESDHILKALWGENTYFHRRSMDVFISKLRKYLSTDQHVKISNVHGKGYILEDSGK